MVKIKLVRLKTIICFLFIFNSFAVQGQQVIYINSDSLRIVRGYSHAVVFPETGIVKTSGIIGTDKLGNLVNNSPQEQIRQTFRNLKNILEASGTSVDSIDEIETFLTDSIYFSAYVQERVAFFKGRRYPPISKTYYTKGLINPQAVVEINVTATVAKKDTARQAVFYVTAILEAKEGKSDQLQELLTANIRPSRNEKGCLQYDLFRDVKNRNLFILHEQWTDRAAFDIHFTMPYMKELSKQIRELINVSTINIMDKLES